MEFSIKQGAIKNLSKIVTKEDTALYYGSGMLEVFATPAMVALMENAAQLCLQEYLPGGFISLGTEINVKHLKATPMGKEVTCKAFLKEAEGKKVLFEIEVSDESGLIGTSTHIRYIVESDKFMKRF